MIQKFSIAELPKVAQQLIDDTFDTYSLFTFTGPLGAGKTSLIKEILRLRGVQETVDSPTFGYVNIYTDKKNNTYHHFDLYRIDTVEEFIGLGFHEHLQAPQSYSFIEWPIVIESFLRQQNMLQNTCSIVLRYDPLDQDKRIIEW